LISQGYFAIRNLLGFSDYQLQSVDLR